MQDNSASTAGEGSIVVAGDICLDVIGIPVPPPPGGDAPVDNWRLTGETRTHYLPGGAMLLETWIRSAAPGWEVCGNRPCRPAALSGAVAPDQPLPTDEFLKLGERLKRDEVVHSLLEVDAFAASPRRRDELRLRIRAKHGFSGPKQGEPTLTVLPPLPAAQPRLVVLDDTGNRFRRSPQHWPEALRRPETAADAIVIYKLHRPLPRSATAAVGDAASTIGAAPDLWRTVSGGFGDRLIVVVSIDDLRDLDAPISRGLSWERTALDVVQHLQHTETFAELKQCRRLIVRLGLDGAIYWQGGSTAPRAWLMYDPEGIEGTAETEHDGIMVGYGSTFTAALTQHVALALRNSRGAGPSVLEADEGKIPGCIEAGMMAGLNASRRLLQLGFGDGRRADPTYPYDDLFAASAGESAALFACEPIPILPSSSAPDRAYWRLLESIFRGKTDLLHTAVELTARRGRARTEREAEAMALLRRAPRAVFAKALQTYDRREIENYRALYTLMLNYVRQRNATRPLSVAVFGPPGAGKSFGVKMVAKSLAGQSGTRPIETVTFNLSQYQSAAELADAFHLVRDLVLQGEVPLVFFDEFDAALDGAPLGWLRYFLAPMQDGVFLDDGVPHPIGQAIFVFAGGTSPTYSDFSRPFRDMTDERRLRFEAAKGPDFLSRLRGTLDVPGLGLDQPFDAYGPVEAFPCEPAILLRRAGILAHQLGEKAPQLRDSAGSLRVSPVVLRTLLHLPDFLHGNRSLEAILDMTCLAGAEELHPSLLPSASQVTLHANARHLAQLVATHYPFPPAEREMIARAIHKRYCEGELAAASSSGVTSQAAAKGWMELSEELRESNREQADHIAVKLRSAGLWFRKKQPGTTPQPQARSRLESRLETLAREEHDRWAAEKRRQGWTAAAGVDPKFRDDGQRLHNALFPWDELTEEQKQQDRRAVLEIPDLLDQAGYELTVVSPSDSHAD